VIETIEAQFGLLPILLYAKDGGNVNTTHNVRGGIYASDKEREQYEQRGEYDSSEYHKGLAYIKIKKTKTRLKNKES